MLISFASIRGLVRSEHDAQVKDGISLLMGECRRSQRTRASAGPPTSPNRFLDVSPAPPPQTKDIYELEPNRRRECLYYLALGHYKLKNYTESKKFLEKLLSKEPNNMQAQSLLGMVDRDVQKEGLIGMAIAGGALTVIGAVAIAAIQKMKR